MVSYMFFEQSQGYFCLLSYLLGLIDKQTNSGVRTAQLTIY